jgi:hypothetical protein
MSILTIEGEREFIPNIVVVLSFPFFIIVPLVVLVSPSGTVLLGVCWQPHMDFDI